MNLPLRRARRPTRMEMGMDMRHAMDFPLAFSGNGRNIPRLVDMSSDASQSTSSIQWMTWLIQNKKSLTTWASAGGLAVLVFLGILVFQAQKEASATAALSEIEVPLNGGLVPEPGITQAYLKVASQFPGTQAAGRAILLAGSALFMNGSYTESQAKFEEFLKSYSDHPWVPQALFGVASSLDAQKQTAAAIEKYEELRRRFATAPISEEARLCLGRLFEQENRNEEAFAIYDELMRTHPSSGLGAEAGLRREDLVARFPDLAKTNEPAATMNTLTPTPVPTPNVVPPNQAPLTIGTNTTTAPISIQLPPATGQPTIPTPAPNAPPSTPAPTPSPSAPASNPAPGAQPPAPAPNPVPAPPKP